MMVVIILIINNYYYYNNYNNNNNTNNKIRYCKAVLILPSNIAFNSMSTCISHVSEHAHIIYLVYVHVLMLN